MSMSAFKNNVNLALAPCKNPGACNILILAGLTYKGLQDNLTLSTSRANYAFGNATPVAFNHFWCD